MANTFDRIETLSPDSAAHVHSIFAQSFSEDWSVGTIEGILRHPSGYHLGVYRSNTLLAFFLSYRFTGTIDVISVATDPNFRNQGLQTQLFLSLMGDPLLDHVLLEVSVLNLTAIRFYKKLGFNINGTRKKYYRGVEDAYCMVWEKVGHFKQLSASP